MSQFNQGDPVPYRFSTDTGGSELSLDPHGASAKSASTWHTQANFIQFSLGFPRKMKTTKDRPRPTKSVHLLARFSKCTVVVRGLPSQCAKYVSILEKTHRRPPSTCAISKSVYYLEKVPGKRIQHKGKNGNW